MKKTLIIAAMAGGLALQALAAGTENTPTPSASTNVKKPTLHQRVSQFLEPKTLKTDRIDRVGGVSSRPWAQTVGWSSGPSQFAGDRERFHDAEFNLFWVGSTPQ